jgi:NADPH-dependent 2,4-dienoyl-CoA reductase/sulfur reductase-like enzyme
MFAFFSNRLGCIGSLIVSVVGSLVLILVLRGCGAFRIAVMVAPQRSPLSDAEVLDAVVIGGGPAGLSATLVLGRCLRRVLVCDAGHPRNEPARIFNGFLSRDGSTPAEFLQICRDQLRRYETIEFRL